MKTSSRNLKTVLWSFSLVVLFVGCESDAERKTRCRDAFNVCMQKCRENRNTITNRYHATSLGCSNTLIEAMKTCDANYVLHSKAWSQCMIAATESYHICDHAAKVTFDTEMLEVTLCEMECELEYIGCLQGM